MVVWVTGASDGIGAALVKEFSKAGYTVVLSARREDLLRKVAEESGLIADKCMILPLDLEHTEGIQKDVDKIIERFGSIDVLLLNAGISQKGMAENTLESVERSIMEVNYFSNTRITKAVLPYMKAKGHGKIAVVSSIIGKFGGPFLSTYAASKHALVGYFESLRYEVNADNISVLIVTPGFIRTGIAKKAVTEDGSAFNEDSKAQEKGTSPDKVASKIRKAVEGGKKHIYVGGPETFTPLFKFVFPGVFYKIWKKLHKL
jgi:short-subunit dehydrogenase